MHLENDSPQTLTTTAETVIAASAPFQQVVESGEIEGAQPVPAVITGMVNVTPGTTASQVQIRVRDGSLTGAVVGVVESDNVVAAVPVNIPFEVFDPTGFVNGYVITAQQVAATANGTVNAISADVNPQ